MLALKTFDFRFETLNDQTLEKMLHETRRFCSEMLTNQQPRWLSLLGLAGTGKTHLAKQITRFFKEQMEDRFIPNQNLDRTRHRMRGGFLSWRKVCERLREGDYGIQDAIEQDYFVVLDDIGSEYKSKSDFTTSKLDQFIDARLGKWTVITANLTLEQISDLMDVRIASRMLRGGSVAVGVKTLDYSIRSKQKQKAA